MVASSPVVQFGVNPGALPTAACLGQSFCSQIAGVQHNEGVVNGRGHGQASRQGGGNFCAVDILDQVLFVALPSAYKLKSRA